MDVTKIIFALVWASLLNSSATALAAGEMQSTCLGNFEQTNHFLDEQLRAHQCLGQDSPKVCQMTLGIGAVMMARQVGKATGAAASARIGATEGVCGVASNEERAPVRSKELLAKNLLQVLLQEREAQAACRPVGPAQDAEIRRLQNDLQKKMAERKAHFGQIQQDITKSMEARVRSDMLAAKLSDFTPPSDATKRAEFNRIVADFKRTYPTLPGDQLAAKTEEVYAALDKIQGGNAAYLKDAVARRWNDLTGPERSLIAEATKTGQLNTNSAVYNSLRRFSSIEQLQQAKVQSSLLDSFSHHLTFFLQKAKAERWTAEQIMVQMHNLPEELLTDDLRRAFQVVKLRTGAFSLDAAATASMRLQAARLGRAAALTEASVFSRNVRYTTRILSGTRRAATALGLTGAGLAVTAASEAAPGVYGDISCAVRTGTQGKLAMSWYGNPQDDCTYDTSTNARTLEFLHKPPEFRVAELVRFPAFCKSLAQMNESHATTGVYGGQCTKEGVDLTDLSDPSKPRHISVSVGPDGNVTHFVSRESKGVHPEVFEMTFKPDGTGNFTYPDQIHILQPKFAEHQALPYTSEDLNFKNPNGYSSADYFETRNNLDGFFTRSSDIQAYTEYQHSMVAVSDMQACCANPPTNSPERCAQYHPSSRGVNKATLNGEGQTK